MCNIIYIYICILIKPLPNNIKCARNIRHFKKLVKLYMST